MMQGTQGDEPDGQQPDADGAADPIDPASGTAADGQQLPQQQQQPPAESIQPQPEDLPQQPGQPCLDSGEDAGHAEGTGSLQKVTWQLGQAGSECPVLQDVIQLRRPPHHRLQIEYSSLSMADKVRQALSVHQCFMVHGLLLLQHAGIMHPGCCYMRLPVVHHLHMRKWTFVGPLKHLASYFKQHLLAEREVLLMHGFTHEVSEDRVLRGTPPFMWTVCSFCL